MTNRTFMTVEEVAAELGVSKSYAYKIVKQLNEELQKFQDTSILESTVEEMAVIESVVEIPLTIEERAKEISTVIRNDYGRYDNVSVKVKAELFQFSIDDFGSGYSSFNLLKDMQVDELKIDKEFLESTEDLKRSRYIIERIVQMAHGLDIRVVCEGVERIEQVQFLREIECDIIQGYYYSKPMPMDEYEKYLEKFDLKH